MKNIKKFKELLLLLVSKFGPGGVVETKLMKLLYFAEAEYFRAEKKTISGVDYFKNNYGPTPDVRVLRQSYDDLDKVLERQKRVANGRPFTLFKVATKDFTYGNLTEREIEVVDKVFKVYGGLSTGQLIKLSHFDPPYLAATAKRDKIEFKFVLYRKDSENDIEEEASDADQAKTAKEISPGSLDRFFDYVGSKA